MTTLAHTGGSVVAKKSQVSHAEQVELPYSFLQFPVKLKQLGTAQSPLTVLHYSWARMKRINAVLAVSSWSMQHFWQV
jgi:hypothetical protein